MSSNIPEIVAFFAVVSLCLHSFVAIYTIIEPQDKHALMTLKESVCEDESLEWGWFHRWSNRFIFFLINAIRLLPYLPGWNCYIGTIHFLVMILIIRIALVKDRADNDLCGFTLLALCVVTEMRHIWYNDLISFATCALIYFLPVVAGCLLIR